MRTILFLSLIVCLSSAILSPMERAKKLVSQMTIDEKINMVGGTGLFGEYAGSTNAIPRLNIPALHLQDGPQGVGDGLKNVTFWPCTLAAVSTWDVELMEKYAAAIGWEQKAKGVNIHLGPMVNIARIPTAGRNFESFGEDPHLSSSMVGPYVRGVQSNGIMATVKHFVDNNQEKNRTITSANVPLRAQWEIYYPAFQAAVDAGVVAAMCSYNKINETWACENHQTLTVDLKGRMGFKGYMMSDWLATHSTVQSANSGLDQQMPNADFFGPALKTAVQNGEVPESRLDDMNVRIFYAAYSVGIMDRPPSGSSTANARNSTHDLLARTVAEASIVLTKNAGNLLPISNSTRKIAIIGDDASKPQAGGAGSGSVVPPYVSTPLQAITDRMPKGTVQYVDSSDVKAAARLAAASDVAIVFVSQKSGEFIDQKSLSLGPLNDELVRTVSKVQKKVIVVAHTPNAVLMPWIDQVSSVLVSTYPGQECGNALASILFGEVNPSGKLPVTFPVSDGQVPANKTINYPGIANEADYSEGIFVGYRWYDQYKHTPLFPFGHGLSYTTFKYSDARIRGDQISIEIANGGKRFGKEVVQFYLGFPESAGEPPKVLRGFKKVALQPNEKTTVTFNLKKEDFQTFSVFTNDWQNIQGTFTAYLGSSSRDIRATFNFSR